MTNKFEIVKDSCRRYPNADIVLPKRATRYSAGYDICVPCEVILEPGQSTVVPTDIKAKVKEDEVLLIYVRSSVGVKRQVALMNGTEVIDSDYYGNIDNDGNICLPLYNYGTQTQVFEPGERVCQGIFMKYDVAEEKTIETIRHGGVGSTNETV